MNAQTTEIGQSFEYPEGPPDAVLNRPRLRLLKRHRAGAVALTVERGDTTHLHSLGQLGAWPQIEESQSAIATDFVILVPGANPHNAQVIWDATAHRLSVAIWAPRRPRRGEQSSSSYWVSWYKALELVGHVPDRAVATVHRGAVTLHIPRVRC